MRATGRFRVGFIVSVLTVLPLASCFHTPNLNDLRCTQNTYCPDGYVCVGAQPESPGKCQQPADAGRSDATMVEDGAANADRFLSPIEGPVTTSDTSAVIDLTASPDISNEPNTAPDLPTSSDLGRDVPSDGAIALSDESADNMAPMPDLGPDLAQDLPYGPEVVPDVPPAGCGIAGTIYDSGATNPANSCQICKPALTTSAWSSALDGTSCGSGPTCSGTTKSYGHWTCQGGSCVQPAATTCPSTGCDTSTGLCKDACGAATTPGPVPCGTTCCASNQFCISNTNCGPKTGPGSACPYGNSQCTTNYCVDGYCCNSNGCGTGETCATGTCACVSNAARVCNVCASWDFEWGTNPSPWLKDLAPSVSGLGLSNGTTSIAVTSSLYHIGTGSHSLMAEIAIETSAANNTAEVAVSLSCATSLAGYRLSAWLYLAGPALTQWNDDLLADTWSGSTTADLQPVFKGGVPTGQWVQAIVTFSSATTVAVNRVGIRLVPSTSWSGQIYIDDVVLTAP